MMRLRPSSPLVCMVVLVLCLAPARGAAFSFADVVAQAEQRAREAYVDHRSQVPPWLLIGKLSYDQWRDIRFRPSQALWRREGLPFQVQFFHPGLYYDRSVRVHTIDAGGEQHPVPFSNELFDYGENDFGKRVPKDIGFAGLRVHHQLKSPGYFDDLIVFLGATYLRALGRDNVYGLSARGLAIDTVEPTGEEFPHFTDFWLETPAPGATSLVVIALMEGPSVAGAYRFTVTPGAQTVVDTQARLFARKPVKKLGIAALTSMFFFGENTRRKFDDFRPEVHDSDGLLLHLESGEWLWRPLDNPLRITASGFRMRNPRGFGLLQRDRDFASHQDLETRSELRPSAWVTPRGDWGDGRVELVEIPTDTEKNDNIVAYWVPDAPAAPGARLDFDYAVAFYSDDASRPPTGRATATRQDSGTDAVGHRFVIDFAGERLGALAAEQPPRAVISVATPESGELLDHHLAKNPSNGGWRLSFQVKRKSAAPIELRAFLASDSEVLTETWSYAAEK